MTRSNPRIEIYYREKGKKRWYRTNQVYPIQRIEEAQSDMKKLFVKNNGKKQFLLKPFVN